MTVAGEGFRQPLVLHHDKRNAIGEWPLLVGTFAVKFSAPLNQFTGGADEPERRVGFHYVTKGLNLVPLVRLAQRIGQFNEHELRGHQG